MQNNIEVEAENFDAQSQTEKRKWYLVSKTNKPKVKKDYDKPHLNGASGGKYLELLPETIYDKKKKVQGTNYSGIAGVMAVVSYNVNFKTPRKYYVWLRGYSTAGGDNSLHVGVNNQWPDSGKQMYICDKSWNKWAWTSYQFKNSEYCSSSGSSKRIFIQVQKPGINKVTFSMREDGIEFDKFILTKSETFKPN